MFNDSHNFLYKLCNRGAWTVIEMLKRDDQRKVQITPIREALPVFDAASAQRLAHALRDAIRPEGSSKMDDALQMAHNIADRTAHAVKDYEEATIQMETLSRLAEGQGLSTRPEGWERSEQKERETAGVH